MSSETETSCCPAGSWPALKSDHVPEGKVEKIGADDKLEIYVVGCPHSGRAVLVLPDIFGIDGGSNKSICDYLSHQGFFVVMPEYFYGDAIVKTPEWMASFAEWAKRYPYSAHVQPIDDALKYIESKGITKTGTIGYCWGCWVAFHMGADATFKDRIKCAVDCHPSTRVEELFFGGNVEDLATSAKDGFPHLMLSANNDPENVREGGSVIGILGTEKGSRVIDFPRMSHGWVNRGDLAQADVAEDTSKALAEATAFLKLHTQ